MIKRIFALILFISMAASMLCSTAGAVPAGGTATVSPGSKTVGHPSEKIRLIPNSRAAGNQTGKAFWSVDYIDIVDHAGESAIKKWSDYGIISGGKDGYFWPDGQVTRSDMAASLVQLIGYSSRAASEPYDIGDNTWVYSNMMKLIAANVIQGSDGYVRPYDPATREEAVTAIARAFDISNYYDYVPAVRSVASSGEDALDYLPQISAEPDQVSAVLNQVSAELDQVSAVFNLASAESDQVSAVLNQASAEPDQVSAESDQVSAVFNLASAESDQVSAVLNQASAEPDQDGAVLNQVSAESDQVSAEPAPDGEEPASDGAEPDQVSVEPDQISEEPASDGAEPDQDVAESAPDSAEPDLDVEEPAPEDTESDGMFADWDDISSWAKGYVYNMWSAGYLDHFGRKFSPKNNITRAEFIMIIDAMFAAYYAQPGVYSDTIDGNIIIRSPGVTFINARINGDVYIVEGVGSGYYAFDNNTVIEGEVFARAGVKNPYAHIDPDKPMVALTFDDGPTGTTVSILDTLEAYGAHATFFVVGSNIGGNINTLNRAVSLGCELGGHSWSHVSLTTLGIDNLIWDTDRVRNALYDAAGVWPAIVRPPNGAYNSTVVNTLGSIGVSTIYWSIDPQDWSHRNANTTYNRIMSNIRDGAIVLMHDLVPSTANAVQWLVPELINRGYQLVTVSEMLAYTDIGVHPGTLYVSKYNYR